MSYYSREELLEMGINYVGENVKISKKAILNNPKKMKFGDNSRVDDLCILSGKIEIGRNVHIAVMCHLDGSKEGIYIEDFAGIAYSCNIFSSTSDYSGSYMTNPTVPIKFRNPSFNKIMIKKHSIIGASSVIFPGVTIEEGTAIGAMSLVTKSTKSWKIYIGNPAKEFGDRSRDLLKLEEEYVKNREDI